MSAVGVTDLAGAAIEPAIDRGDEHRIGVVMGEILIDLIQGLARTLVIITGGLHQGFGDRHEQCSGHPLARNVADGEVQLIPDQMEIVQIATHLAGRHQSRKHIDVRSLRKSRKHLGQQPELDIPRDAQLSLHALTLSGDFHQRTDIAVQRRLHERKRPCQLADLIATLGRQINRDQLPRLGEIDSRQGPRMLAQLGQRAGNPAGHHPCEQQSERQPTAEHNCLARDQRGGRGGHFVGRGDHADVPVERPDILHPATQAATVCGDKVNPAIGTCTLAQAHQRLRIERQRRGGLHNRLTLAIKYEHEAIADDPHLREAAIQLATKALEAGIGLALHVVHVTHRCDRPVPRGKRDEMAVTRHDPLRTDRFPAIQQKGLAVIVDLLPGRLGDAAALEVGVVSKPGTDQVCLGIHQHPAGPVEHHQIIPAGGCDRRQPVECQRLRLEVIHHPTLLQAMNPVQGVEHGPVELAELTLALLHQIHLAAEQGAVLVANRQLGHAQHVLHRPFFRLDHRVTHRHQRVEHHRTGDQRQYRRHCDEDLCPQGMQATDHLDDNPLMP